MNSAATTVLVLMGGTSDERAVSLRSGAAVTAGLEEAGYSTEQFDYQGTLPTTVTADIIFPLLHGAGGEDGVLQAELEARGIHSYVGSDAEASRLCMNKWRYKELLREHGITSPDGDLITETSVENHRLAKKSFVLKPYNGGSSVDTFIVRDLAHADFTAMDAARERHGQMLIEELIEGIEITVAVLGDRALPVIEIIPPANEEFDYDNKYNGHTQELCPPVHVSEAAQAEAQSLALKLHTLCECRDYSRTDMIITSSGELYVLETNTIPGMTNQSLVPKAAATAGISMTMLVDQLATMALARKS